MCSVFWVFKWPQHNLCVAAICYCTVPWREWRWMKVNLINETESYPYYYVSTFETTVHHANILWVLIVHVCCCQNIEFILSSEDMSSEMWHFIIGWVIPVKTVALVPSSSWSSQYSKRMSNNHNVHSIKLMLIHVNIAQAVTLQHTM